MEQIQQIFLTVLRFIFEQVDRIINFIFSFTGYCVFIYILIAFVGAIFFINIWLLIVKVKSHKKSNIFLMFLFFALTVILPAGLLYYEVHFRSHSGYSDDYYAGSVLRENCKVGECVNTCLEELKSLITGKKRAETLPYDVL